ncbi:hypothetical protein AWH63_10825 [Marinobacter sp. C18]|uniref:hypothetical protein n=1 Tax=Marinobacter sp. C18 TaxID=1772288 RepID=UPI000948A001|nr:hypothetical protein [Marinobacter sp. C18]OLF82024.1 hypothetical protein AWH63_10825 [Marinobacter sp. C18]
MTESASHETAIVQPMDDSLYRQVTAALTKAQYSPYKLWMIGDPGEGERRHLKVLNIKVEGGQCFSVCPELHLVAHGSDYLDTTSQMTQAIMKKLGVPQGTPIAQTDIVPFDVDGNPLRSTPAKARAPELEAQAKPSDTTASADEQIQRAPEGLFANVTEEIDLETVEDEGEDIDQIQASLF